MRKKLLSLGIILLLIFSLSSNLSGKITTKVEGLSFLPREDYYVSVRKAIKEARESIYIAMYIMRYHNISHHPADILIKELIAAHKRGIKVKVILDEFATVTREEKKEPMCQPAYEVLKKNGVDVRFDSPEVLTHTKLVVVDEYLTFVGSANWSISAFKFNNESSVLIKSKKVARELLESVFPDYVARTKAVKLSSLKEVSPQGRLQMAENYYLNKMYKQALREYQKIIKEFPESKEATIARERIGEIKTR